MTFQALLDIVHTWLDGYYLIGDFFTREFTIGGETLTVISAISGSLIFLLGASFTLHLMHLINPLG